MKVQKIVCLTLVIFFLSACGNGDYSKELSGGYFFRAEGKELNDILSHTSSQLEIPANVISYDYNSHFIIAAQRPGFQDPLYNNDPIYSLGKDTIYFWLIVHSEKLVLGPLEKTEFEQNLIKYNVDRNLKLEPVD
jgi:hypothetical protein